MTVSAVQMHEKDNVATMLADVLPGDEIRVLDLSGKTLGSVRSREAVPKGHKVAVADLAAAVGVVKYGEKIGRTTAPVKRGQWVHVHNVESLRGRGDLHG